MAARVTGKRRLSGSKVLLFILLCAGVYLSTLAARIYFAGERDDCDSADVIIVLGAAQHDGKPWPILQGRLDHALALYRQGYAPYLLFTGGRKPGDRFTEAGTGQRYAIEHGIPESATLLEDQGRTTMQSLQAALDIMDRHHLRSAILVSDPFHAFRLRRMARDIGMSAVVSPTAQSAVRSWHTQASYISREVGVYTVYRLVGI